MFESTVPRRVCKCGLRRFLPSRKVAAIHSTAFARTLFRSSFDAAHRFVPRRQPLPRAISRDGTSEIVPLRRGVRNFFLERADDVGAALTRLSMSWSRPLELATSANP